MLLLHYGMSGRAGRGEDGRGKARHGERGNADAAIADLQADLAVAPFVKVVMGGEEGIRLARRHTGEPVAVMMAVAFGQIGRAHVWTPVHNAQPVCSPLLEKK